MLIIGGGLGVAGGAGMYLKVQPNRRSYLQTKFSRDDCDRSVYYKYEVHLQGDTRLARKIHNPVVTVSITYYPSLQVVDLLWFKNEYSAHWTGLPMATWRETRCLKYLGTWTLAQALNDIEKLEKVKPRTVELYAGGQVPFKSEEGLFKMYQQLGFSLRDRHGPEMSGHFSLVRKLANERGSRSTRVETKSDHCSGGGS